MATLGLQLAFRLASADVTDLALSMQVEVPYVCKNGSWNLLRAGVTLRGQARAQAHVQTTCTG